MKNAFETNRMPSVEEYQSLRHAVGWDPVSDEMVREGLSNGLKTYCVDWGDSIVGMGRLIGDDALYFYIQDVMVHPEVQDRGIGTMIMNEIETYLDAHAGHHAFVGLMAAEGVAEFYKAFGYRTRPDKCPGMFKMIEKPA